MDWWQLSLLPDERPDTPYAEVEPRLARKRPPQPTTKGAPRMYFMEVTNAKTGLRETVNLEQLVRLHCRDGKDTLELIMSNSFIEVTESYEEVRDALLSAGLRPGSAPTPISRAGAFLGRKEG